jgi:hypothetical protein
MNDNTITLSNGMKATVSSTDFAYLNSMHWYMLPSGENPRPVAATGYIKGNVNTRELMHRIVAVRMGLRVSGMDVDHVNGDTLDNRRENIRVCTHTQNMMNRRKLSPTSSRYKGVSARGKKWRAYIRVGGKLIHIGTFCDEEEAARAYNEYANKYFGEYALLNDL